MTNLWIALGFVSYATYCFSILLFAVKILKYSKKNIFLLLFFTLFNTCTFIVLYFYGVPWAVLYVIGYFGYFVELRLCTKTSFRQVWFFITSYLLSMVAVHLTVLLVYSMVLQRSLGDIYVDVQLLFQTVVVSCTLLIVLIKIYEKYIPVSKFVDISTAKIYSEIMSSQSTFLFAALCAESWFLMKAHYDPLFSISALATIFFVMAMFYVLFYFNTNITVLHPYKRKADEAKTLHGKIIKKKIAAEYKLYSDDLTKLYNKRFINQKIDELCESKDTNFAVVYADLVALKYVNDTYGHKVGDRYILDIATILQKSIREEDFPARVGGDEFVIILMSVTENEMEEIIRRIKKSIRQVDEKEEFTVHANFGYKCFDTKDGLLRAEVLEKVDELMKHDKKAFYEKGGF